MGKVNEGLDMGSVRDGSKVPHVQLGVIYSLGGKH